MIYKRAFAIANHTIKQLEPHCERINLAGSVLRQKPDCGDLEVVALSKIISQPDGLFDDKIAVRDPEFVKTVRSLGKIVKGDPATGRMIQVQIGKASDATEFMDNCIMLDLFLPTKEDYYRIYNIRIGSSDYSHKVLAMAWRSLGWYGTAEGLRRADECENVGTEEKPKWKCIAKNATLPPVWKTDAEFWEWIKLPFLEPKDRI